MDLANATRIGLGRTAEVYAWGEGKVLKLLHAWAPAAWAEEEHRVTAAVSQAGLPAPRVHGLERVEGRVGIVFERIEGPSLLAEVLRRPWRAGWVGRRLAEVQAALHARRVPGLGPLTDRLRWSIDHAALPGPVRDEALAALARLPAGDAVCHFDVHPDNVLLTPRGPVVIDWAEVSSGHPLADVTRTSLMLEYASPPSGALRPLIERVRGALRRAHLRRYLELTGTRREALAPFLLPVAAARTGQAIEGERPALLELLGRLAA